MDLKNKEFVYCDLSAQSDLNFFLHFYTAFFLYFRRELSQKKGKESSNLGPNFHSIPHILEKNLKNVPPNYIFENTCSFHLYLEEGLSQDLVL